MPVPDSLWNALTLVGGFALFCLGISFGWKFFQAAFLGKLTYWSGLEKFGFLFIPITFMLSPLLVHLPYDPKKSLIQEKQQMWIHLVWAPAFSVCALMCMTSGADLMGLPGSTCLNTVLTLGRSDVPACIVYTPPFSYKFPFVRKATKTILRALTIRVPQDKKNSYNAFEQRGDVDASEYSHFGGDDIFYDDDDKAQTAPAPAASVSQHSASSSHTAGHRSHH
jgi:hypothetical protein